MTETWAEVVARPLSAGTTVRTALRAARHLHSRERRLVQDGLYALMRHHVWLAAEVGDSPEALWRAWIDGERTPPDDLALAGSLPAAGAAALVDAFGQDGAWRFLEASNRRADTVLRTNRRLTRREALLKRLTDDGIEAVACDTPDAVRVVGRANLVGHAAFREGWFELQDEAHQEVARFAATPGRVVDWCAGAGGKSLAMAAAGASVVACDVRQSALDELRRRAKRSRATIEVHRHPWTGSAPTVLVDAPCSGSGVLRRHPENRWRMTAALLEDVGRQQRDILAAAAEAVAPGGTLIYATCSVLRRENEQVVADFLGAHPSFTAGEILRRTPHEHGTDGAFAQKLLRQ